MKPPKYGPIFIAILIFLILNMSFLFYADNYIKKIHNVDQLAGDLNPNKLKGLFISEKILSNHHSLIFMDSSDLNTGNGPKPSRVFAGKPTGFIPYLVGHAGYQSIIHLLNLAALDKSVHNQKIVLLLSPQWFNDYGGDLANFRENFSALHAYSFVFNSHISADLKAKIAERLLYFNRVKWDPVLTILLSGLIKHNKQSTISASLAEPLGRGILFILEQIDNFYSFALIIEHKNDQPQYRLQKSINWQDIMNKAEMDGAKACRKNSLGMDDKYYYKNKSLLANYQNSAGNKSYLNSTEYQDVQLLVALCKELRAQLLIILEPVNGYWYDFTGFPKVNRRAYFAKIRRILKDSGCRYVDLSNHEYDKYFMYDKVHLGLKGWAYVDQIIDQFYHDKLKTIDGDFK